jgi:acylphosphatase
MKKLTAYVSGRVQKAGYRARVIAFAEAFGLKGIVQNLDDGRLRIIAAGEETVLEQFIKAIDIKNTVKSVLLRAILDCQFEGNFEVLYPSRELLDQLNQALIGLELTA